MLAAGIIGGIVFTALGLFYVAMSTQYHSHVLERALIGVAVIGIGFVMFFMSRTRAPSRTR